jgi:hypothetical protein
MLSASIDSGQTLIDTVRRCATALGAIKRRGTASPLAIGNECTSKATRVSGQYGSGRRNTVCCRAFSGVQTQEWLGRRYALLPVRIASALSFLRRFAICTSTQLLSKQPGEPCRTSSS